jgi:hypothetical protein
MKTKSKNALATENKDLEIPTVTREQMKRGVMGYMYRKVMAGSNLVRIDAELSHAFPNEAAVNQALRELLKMRETLVSITADKAKRKKSA